MIQTPNPDMKFFEVQDNTEVYAALSKEEIIRQFKDGYGIELEEDEHLEEVDGDSGNVLIRGASDDSELEGAFEEALQALGYDKRNEKGQLRLSYRQIYTAHCHAGTADQSPLMICSANY